MDRFVGQHSIQRKCFDSHVRQRPLFEIITCSVDVDDGFGGLNLDLIHIRRKHTTIHTCFD